MVSAGLAECIIAWTPAYFPPVSSAHGILKGWYMEEQAAQCIVCTVVYSCVLLCIML
jgi:hypothetical protein